jgi:outer membrane immunogenic protein
VLSYKNMTTRRFCAAALLALAAFDGSAQAQSPRLELPPYVSGPSWTGFYAGVSFGAGGTLRRATGRPGDGPESLTVDGVGGEGVLASLYGGADYQVLPRAVVGLLAEGTWSSISSALSASAPADSANITSQADLGLALLARGGVLVTPSSLLYLLGGYAGQNFHTTGTAAAGGAFASFARDDWFNGWTVGGGFETRLRGGWSAKLEYRFARFEQKFIPGPDFTFEPFLHTARLGLAYRFGAGGQDGSDTPAPDRRSWTGLYGGVAGGAGLTVDQLSTSFRAARANAETSGQGLLGSVLVGGDYQLDDGFVIGAMGDLTWPGMQSVLTIAGPAASATTATRTNMGWNLLARAGWLATPSTLLYALGGYSNQSFTTTGYAGNGATLFQSDDRLSGFVVGPGLEFMIAPGWSTRLEYRYSQYETRTLLNGVTLQPTSHTARVGLSYKFGIN